MDRTGLTVSEVWYIHADEVTVHPNATTAAGETAHPPPSTPSEWH